MNKDGRQSSGLYKPCPCLKEKHRSRLGECMGREPARKAAGWPCLWRSAPKVHPRGYRARADFAPAGKRIQGAPGRQTTPYAPWEQKIAACRKPGDLL